MAGETTLAGQEQEGPQEDLGRQGSGRWDENSRCKGPEVGVGSSAQKHHGAGAESWQAEQAQPPPVRLRPQRCLLRKALQDHPATRTPSPSTCFLSLAALLSLNSFTFICFLLFPYWTGSTMRVRAWAVAKGSNG